METQKVNGRYCLGMSKRHINRVSQGPCLPSSAQSPVKARTPDTYFKGIPTLGSFQHTYMSTQMPCHIHMSRHPPLGKQVTVCKLLEATKICFGGEPEQTRNNFASGHRWLSFSAYNGH